MIPVVIPCPKSDRDRYIVEEFRGVCVSFVSTIDFVCGCAYHSVLSNIFPIGWCCDDINPGRNV